MINLEAPTSLSLCVQLARRVLAAMREVLAPMKRLSIQLLVLVLALVLLTPNLAAAAGRTHTVQNGETLTSIAAQYGVSVDALTTANGIAAPNLIFVGETLTIPGGASAPPAARVAPDGGYVVQPGDNLSTIAARYGVSLDSLVSANGLNDSNFIWAGQHLTIPSQAPAPAPAAPPPPAPAGGSSYAVQAGDNLSTIAARYGVDVHALAQANGIANPNLLFSGQVLTIPGKGAQPAAPSSPPAPPAKPPPPVAPPPPPAVPIPTLAPAPPAPQGQPPIQVAPTPAPNKEKVVPASGTGALTVYVVQAGDRLYNIAADHNTTVDAIMARNNLHDANLIFAGQTLEILAGDMISKPPPAGQAPPTPQSITQPVVKPGTDQAPPAIDKGSAGKWIDVNLSTERLTAYEGNTAVFTTLVSTGVSWHPTVVGTYRIYAKYLADDMSGGYGAEYYYLPRVPYTMYFYGGYAIHGTYWHHNFGHPMSHGCVNLPTPAAQGMF